MPGCPRLQRNQRASRWCRSEMEHLGCPNIDMGPILLSEQGRSRSAATGLRAARGVRPALASITIDRMRWQSRLPMFTRLPQMVQWVVMPDQHVPAKLKAA